MAEADNLLKVTFHDEAAADWRRAFPDLPPGPEVVLYMEFPQTCKECGAVSAMDDQELWAMDPEGITDDGVIVGDVYCNDCIKAGH